MTTPTTQISTSLIRTIVPMIVGWLLAQLAIRGLNIDPGLIEQLVTWGITSAYYVAVRIFETHVAPRLGWLLGLPKQPTYDAKAAPSEDSPTGAVATEDTTGVPAGQPVAVLPVEEDGSLGDPLAEFGGSVTAGVHAIANHALSQEYSADAKLEAALHEGEPGTRGE